MRASLLAVAALAWAGALPAQSIGGHPEGLMISLRAVMIPGYDYHMHDWQTLPPGDRTHQADAGVGMGLWLGWGFTDWLALYGGFDLAGHSSDNFDGGISGNYFDLGLRFSAPIEGSVIPFGELAIGSEGFTGDPSEDTDDGIIWVGDEIGSDIFAWTVGGGLQMGVFELALHYTRGTFPDDDQAYTGALSSLRVTAGLTLWFDVF